jgi:hypothetical protein
MSRIGRSRKGIRKFIKEGKEWLKNLTPKRLVSFEELLLSNVFTQEALINLLEAKGIVKKAELLEEIKRVRNRKAET